MRGLPRTACALSLRRKRTATSSPPSMLAHSCLIFASVEGDPQWMGWRLGSWDFQSEQEWTGSCIPLTVVESGTAHPVCPKKQLVSVFISSFQTTCSCALNGLLVTGVPCNVHAAQQCLLVIPIEVYHVKTSTDNQQTACSVLQITGDSLAGFGREGPPCASQHIAADLQESPRTFSSKCCALCLQGDAPS